MAAANEYFELVKSLLTEKRCAHSFEVMHEAVRLAERFGADAEKARLAGLLHDVTKETGREGQIELCGRFGIKLPDELLKMPKVLHSFTGAEYIKIELGIDDAEILDAVRYHTTGRKGMSLLEKIIYIADCVEPRRDYPGVEHIRQALEISIDDAMITALTLTMQDLLCRGQMLCGFSVAARNQLLINKLSGGEDK